MSVSFDPNHALPGYVAVPDDGSLRGCCQCDFMYRSDMCVETARNGFNCIGRNRPDGQDVHFVGAVLPATYTWPRNSEGAEVEEDA